MEHIKSLILRITERCNLACDYCYAACHNCKNTDMSVETALKAVALCCPENGGLRIQFTGGEPLLNIGVMEAVFNYGKATNRKLILSVQTNGTLLTPEICRRLAAMKCAVGVSLDGIREANSLRHFPDGTPAQSHVIDGIRNLGQLGIRCNLTTVVTSANAAMLGQLPDLALWLGNVRGVGLDLFRPLGRGASQHLVPDEAALQTGLTALIRKTKEIQAAGVPFRLREMERLKKRCPAECSSQFYCYAQTEQSICIDSAGDCWPCSSLAGNAGFYLGNIREGIPENQPCRPELLAPEKCKSCPFFSICIGGCPAGRVGRNGTADPMTCMMTKTLLKEMGR